VSALRTVLDTNILVSALLSPEGNPAKILKLISLGLIIPVFSVAVFSEYREVLSRPRLSLDASKVNMLLDAIRELGEEVFPVTSEREMMDEDDRAFYDAARSVGAYLITGNKKHFPDEPFI
jgi:putative PIN family toxin of toxin-antitoxin system